jgi:hypothetical protein
MSVNDGCDWLPSDELKGYGIVWWTSMWTFNELFIFPKFTINLFQTSNNTNVRIEKCLHKVLVLSKLL